MMKLQTRSEADPDLTHRLWVEAVPAFDAGGASSEHGPVAVHLMVSGDLDEVTSSSMASAAHAALDADPDTLVLDLSGVVFVDTAGLRAIIETANTAERCGIRLVVGGMSGGVERLLELTGLVEQLSHADHRSINPN